MSNRITDRLSHVKSDRSIIKTGFPSKEEGVDGNIEIRYIPGYGLMLFAFYSGNWYVTKMEIQKISKDKKTLSVDKLEINKELDLSGKPIKNLNPDKVQGAEKWNDAYNNLHSGDFRPRFGQITINDVVLVPINGTLEIQNNSGDKASIIAKELKFPTTLATGSLTAETGQTSFNTDDGGFRFWGNAIVIDANTDADSSNETCNVVGISKAADCSLKLFDGATLKWYMAYDYSTDSILGAGALVFGTGGSIGAGERVKIKLTTGDADTVMLWQYDDTNYSTLTTAANGAATLATVDSDGTAGHINLDADGDIKLDPASGKINIAMSDKLYFDGGTETYIVEEFNSGAGDIFSFYSGGDKMLSLDEANDKIIMGATNWVAGTVSGDTVTEFSAANSAYAGMILGYTRIQNNSTTTGHAVIAIDHSSMAVLQTAQGTNLSIQFKVPPSGNVEIECSMWLTGISKGAKFSLSTGTSYAELDETHTYDTDYTVYIDESDHSISTIKFSVSGLTPGTDTTYYLAGLASASGMSIGHGRNRTSGDHYPPIILKATALPATIVTGE